MKFVLILAVSYKMMEIKNIIHMWLLEDYRVVCLAIPETYLDFQQVLNLPFHLVSNLNMIIIFCQNYIFSDTKH